MVKKITWSVERSDGRYVGQSAAFSPQTAFCDCMFVHGKQVVFEDIHFEELDNGAGKIIYQSEEFVLTPLRIRTDSPSSPFNE